VPARLAEETADRDIALLIAVAGFGTSGALAGAPLTAEREMLQVNCGAVVELAATLGRAWCTAGAAGSSS
jgi:short-subunit dehydrogenase